MKKGNRLFVLIPLALLFSCTNAQKDKAKSNTEVINRGQAKKSELHSSEKPKHGNIFSDGTYSYSNDSLCEDLRIKAISLNKEIRIPEKLDFKLILHDKLHRYEDKVLEGVAKLFSSEESFADNSENDGGDYDAADYDFKTADYGIVIRLDIQNYEACVAQITANHPETVLGGFKAYIENYPNYVVMKRGECK